MPSTAIRILTEAFKGGWPVVLFAGQSFDVQGGLFDPVIAALLERVGRGSSSPLWSAVLKGKLSSADMEWLAERFSRFVPSEGALAAYDLPWSAVFTSSLDPNFSRRFETRGRQPEAVLAAGTFARVPRSRSRPPIYHVLGRAGEATSDMAAPTDQAGLKRRTFRHGVELLNRIAETATAKGVVVIAGFDPANDWLGADELLAPLSERVGVKVVWFGASNPVKSAFAAEMIESGVLHLESGSLANAIAEAGASWTEYSASATPDEPSMVTLPSGILDVTPAVRLRVEASAAIVDDGWTGEPEALHGVAIEDTFKRFHGDLSGFRGRVEGIIRGFAFRRAFESDLIKVLEATLRRLGQSDGVVLIHGQSGTGKSVALARLTHHIREHLRLPVLAAMTHIPSVADIDAFCSEAERAGASATVLLCDANQSHQRYLELASALKSRGRRLLIVGTSYRIEPRLRGKTGQYVEAPAKLLDAEVGHLRKLLSRFVPDLLEVRIQEAEGSNALAMLYRSISQGREYIRQRVNAEARFTEHGLRQQATRTPVAKPRSQLGEQLVAAGISTATSSLFAEDEKAALLGLDASGRLIDYVMAPGRLDCPVPLNLIMRMLSRHSSALEVEQLVHLFADLDLFRWHSPDREGTEYLIGPRLQLEAELICRGRLGDTANEIARLVDLIGGVEASGVDHETERTFLLDLLQKLDRDGPRGDAYRDGYLSFAEALTKLRREQGVLVGPLMVRECVFRRQAIWAQDGAHSAKTLDEGRRLEILDEARSIVEEAFMLIDSGILHASKRTRRNLASERASIYGYLAVQRIRNGDPEGAWADYLAAKAASTRAMALTDDYHPVDISLWTSADVLKALVLDDERRAEIVADIYAGLDLVDVSSLSANQQARYLDRKNKLGEIIDDAALSEDALMKLQSVAPAAASFLIARKMAPPLNPVEGSYDETQRRRAGAAADFLAQRSDRETADDPRCARLLLRLRWAEATGQRLLQGQRGITPADPGQVSNLLIVVTGINERAGTDSRNSERYLEAVLAWLARDFNRALTMWRALSRDTEYEDRWRIVRRLIASDASGAPRLYRGRVEGTKGTSDWRVRVEGLNTTISLLAHEFTDQDLAHGRELRDFGVAFNYAGPIADPLTRSGSRR